MFTLVLSLVFLLISQVAVADPAVVYFDPGMTHEMYGVNRLPTEPVNWTFDLHLSPFYQHSTGARNKCGLKVPLGDRLGHWEMFPLLWGDTSAAPKEFNETNYPNYYSLTEKILDLGDGTAATEEGFEGDKDYDGDYSVTVSYEKKGLRFEFDIAMKAGFGMTVKSGIVDYYQKPFFRNASTVQRGSTLGDFVWDTLMTDTMRHALLECELGLDTDMYSTVAFEDTFVQLYWSQPFKCEDKKGDHIVTIHPYLGAGVWIPTGKKKDQGRAFSMPTGHDGFWGASLEVAINFEFPNTVLFNVGGSMTFFETKTQCMRVPNHRYQAGVYPFKTNVSRRYGTGWNVNCSLHAYDIMDNLSVYFDYLYSKHEQDDIRILDCEGCIDCSGSESCSGGICGCSGGSCSGGACSVGCSSLCSTADTSAFLPCKLEKDSLWKSHMIQLGFEYEVCNNLSFGVSGQTHISGMRVYKTHTIMGTIKLVF